MARIIGIAGAKGGVGKTTLAINLGHALTDFGREVIIVDMDLRRPHLGLVLGYENTPKCVHTALSGEDKILQCIYMHPCGLRIIPGDASPKTQHAPEDSHRLYEMLVDVYDYTELIIVDTPPGADVWHHALFTGMTDLILVTTPDIVGMHDCLRTLHESRDSGVNVLGVVINRTEEHEDILSPSEIEAHLAIPVIGAIPYGKEVLEAQRHKHPVTFTDISCPASIAFKRLAANLIGEKYEPVIELSAKDYIMKRIGFKD